MLIVTRRLGEGIVIELPTGELIEVTVVRVDDNQVRLGTTATLQIVSTGPKKASARGQSGRWLAAGGSEEPLRHKVALPLWNARQLNA